MSKEKAKIRLNFVVSPEINESLEALAEKTGGTKSEVFRRAIALMEVVVEAQQQGKKVGIADKAQLLITEIVTL